MTHIFEKNLSHFKAGTRQYLQEIGRGIEKEGLRCDPQGRISLTPHPNALGHPLTHPEVTTDYAESLMELITPVFHSVDDTLAHLRNVHQFVQSRLEHERIWAGSMPCQLDGEESIVIAQYGESNLAKLKMIYREGLGARYGRTMQSIAGMHYNFSLSDNFWQSWQDAQQSTSSLKDFKSEQYFSLIRNFRRYSGLIMYLFGASPAFDKSFLPPTLLEAHPSLEQINERTYLMRGATSLRMGDMGYHNNAQSGLNICFNKLENFVTSLNRAIRTPYPPYEKMGLFRDGKQIQLNTNILQIENEYYSSIRPKRTTLSGEKPIHALSERGVEYIEIRCLDLDPFEPLGVNASTLRFLDVFLLYCLLEDSPWIDDEECERIERTFGEVVQQGRNAKLTLNCHVTGEPMRAQAQELLSKLQSVAKLFEDGMYLDAVNTHMQKIDDPSRTPSAKIERAIVDNEMEYLQLVNELSGQHQKTLVSKVMDEETARHFNALQVQSLEDEQTLFKSDQVNFAQFLENYLS